MPRNLLVIRHAESESNAAKRASDRGKPYSREKELMSVHTSERRLTPRGEEQAKAAGRWIFLFAVEQAALRGQKTFDSSRFFVSPYVRAMETAGLMRLPVDWRADARLCERNWGQLDHMTHEERIKCFGGELSFREARALYWKPEAGDSMQFVMLLLWSFFDMLHRQCSDLDVYTVSHGETMWVLRFLLEHWMPKELAEMMLASDKNNQIKNINCRIIHYTRECMDGTFANRFVRVRLVNPEKPDDPKTNLPWQPIVQREFTSEELLEYVNTFPHFLRGEIA